MKKTTSGLKPYEGSRRGYAMGMGMGSKPAPQATNGSKKKGK